MNLNPAKEYLGKIPKLFNRGTIKNIVLMSSGIILFLVGVIVYGIILNLKEVTLKEAMLSKGYEKLTSVNLVIDRQDYSLYLYQDSVLIKSYRANFGHNLQKEKTKTGDGATPVGTYKICKIDSTHKYHRFLRINYPNLEDAVDALRRGTITQREFNELKFEFYYDDCPNPDTELGGSIGIHGTGRLNYIFKNLPFVYNWTDGSVALSNENLDEILSVVKVGTKVVIR